MSLVTTLSGLARVLQSSPRMTEFTFCPTQRVLSTPRRRWTARLAKVMFPSGSRMKTPSRSASKTLSMKPFSRTRRETRFCTSLGENLSSLVISLSRKPSFMSATYWHSVWVYAMMIPSLKWFIMNVLPAD